MGLRALHLCVFRLFGRVEMHVIPVPPAPGWRPGCPESLRCGQGQVGFRERPAVQSMLENQGVVLFLFWQVFTSL